jgi:hypothetical protein
MCDVNGYVGEDDELDDDDQEVLILPLGSDDDNEDGLSSENPVGTLRLLKQMLDEGLISQREYDEKKKEVLSRL